MRIPCNAVGLNCIGIETRKGADGQTCERHAVVAALAGVAVGLPIGEGQRFCTIIPPDELLDAGDPLKVEENDTKRASQRCGAPGQTIDRHAAASVGLPSGGLPLGVTTVCMANAVGEPCTAHDVGEPIANAVGEPCTGNAVGEP